jgi:hypothetical protein
MARQRQKQKQIVCETFNSGKMHFQANLFRSEIILESSNWKSKNKDRGFFIRLKPREDYFGVAVHEGDGDSDSDGEPILSVKDREDPIQNLVVRRLG